MTGNQSDNKKYVEANGVDGRRLDELSVLATTRGLDQLTAEEEQVLSGALTKSYYQELQGASEQASRVAATVAAAITSDELPTASPELRTLLESRLEAQREATAVSLAKAPQVLASSQQALARGSRIRSWSVLGTVCAIVVLIVFLQFPAAWSQRRLVRVVDAPRPDQSESVLMSGMKQREPSRNIARPESLGMSELAQPGIGESQSLPTDATTSEGLIERAEENERSTVPAPTQPVMRGRAITVTREVSDGVQGADRALIQQTDEAVKLTKELQEARIKSDSAAIHPEGAVTQSTVPQTPVPMPSSGPAPATSLFDVKGNKLNVEQSPSPAETRPSQQPANRFAITGPTNTDGYAPPHPFDGSPTPKSETRRQALVPVDGNRWYREGEVINEPLAESKGRRETLLGDRLVLTESESRESSGETYDVIHENSFRLVRDEPLSTFSVDVDTASYANVRRFLTQGRLPPANAVRIEELLNYFSYDYSEPVGNDPFSANLEVTECPWRPENRLLRVALKGREIPQESRTSSNLVFLIDVSGSMQPENKLPLIQTALKMLVRELTESDRVSIVTYAGDAGLKLPSTNGTEQRRMLDTIESLRAGGSTHGSAGIELAYEQASQYFIPEGTNRVILLTDGDLNVGITDDDALVKLIQKKAKSGVFLTVLGVGEGNLKDSKMEKLADHGNGIYAYLDSVREARKVLVEQMAGSLITIAKDVKFQIEFNPAQVQAYRLIGYENRVLANRDFNDDKKDAGEIGAGHTVTALYELVPAGVPRSPAAEPLKYQPERSAQKTSSTDDDGESKAASSEELLTLKLRFKKPDSDRSVLREFPLTDRGGKFSEASTDFRFAGSVAMFGMVLRNSAYRGNATLSAVEEIAASSLGPDAGGYRAEFVDLVRKADQLK